MNRVILLLNTAILVVTFVLALSATDAQIGLLQSASGISMRSARRVESTDSAIAYLRVIQSLDNIVPRSTKLSPDQFGAIHEAVRRYKQVVDAGVSRSLVEEADEDPRRGYDRLGKEARDAIEHALANAFSDRSTLRRLTTEVIKHCR